MYFSKFKLILLLLSFTLIISSCNDNSSDPNDDNNDDNNIIEGGISFIIDGGSFSNEKFEIDDFGMSYYDPNGNTTVINFNDESEEITASITFKGKDVGTYSIDAEEVLILIQSPSLGLMGIISGTLNITKYGNTGSTVEGTFSGNAMTPTNPSVDIKDGKFSAKVIY